MYWTDVSGEMFGNPWKALTLGPEERATAGASVSSQAEPHDLATLARQALATVSRNNPAFRLDPDPANPATELSVRVRQLGFLKEPGACGWTGVNPFLIELKLARDETAERDEVGRPRFYVLAYTETLASTGERQPSAAVLNGSSQPLHQIAKAGGGVGGDDRQVAEFVDFFCSFLAADGGDGWGRAFGIILRPDEAWAPPHAWPEDGAPEDGRLHRGEPTDTEAEQWKNRFELLIENRRPGSNAIPSNDVGLMSLYAEALAKPPTFDDGTSGEGPSFSAVEGGLVGIANAEDEPSVRLVNVLMAYGASVFKNSIKVTLRNVSLKESISVDVEMIADEILIDGVPLASHYKRNYRSQLGAPIFTQRKVDHHRLDLDINLEDPDVRRWQAALKPPLTVALERAIRPSPQSAGEKVEPIAPTVSAGFVQIEGKTLTDLNLTGKTLFEPVRFRNCRFQGKVNLDDSRIEASLEFVNCQIAGEVSAENVRVGNSLRFRDCTIWGLDLKSVSRKDIGSAGPSDKPLVNLKNAVVGNEVSLARSTVRGVISLNGLSCERDLRLDGLHVLPLTPTVAAIEAGARDVSATRAYLELTGARIGGDLRLTSSWATDQASDFNDASSTTESSFRNCWVVELINLSGARVEGAVYATGLSCRALWASSTRIGSHVAGYIPGDGGRSWQAGLCIIENGVDLSYATVGGFVDFRGWLVGGSFDLSQSEIGGFVSVAPFLHVRGDVTQRLHLPVRPGDVRNGENLQPGLDDLLNGQAGDDRFANYGQTQILGDLDMRGMRCAATLNLCGARVAGTIRLDGAKVDSIKANPAAVCGNGPSLPHFVPCEAERLIASDLTVRANADLAGIALGIRQRDDQGDPSKPVASFINVEIMGDLRLSRWSGDAYLDDLFSALDLNINRATGHRLLDHERLTKSEGLTGPFHFIENPADAASGDVPFLLTSRIHGDILIRNSLVDGELEFTGLNHDVEDQSLGRLDLIDVKIMGDVRALVDDFEINRPQKTRAADLPEQRARLTVFNAEMIQCDADVHLTGLQTVRSRESQRPDDPHTLSTVNITDGDIRGRLQFYHRRDTPTPKADSASEPVRRASIWGSIDLTATKARHLVLSGKSMAPGGSERDIITMERATFDRLDIWDPIPVAVNLGGIQVRRVHVREDDIDLLKTLLKGNVPESSDVYATIARSFMDQGRSSDARQLLQIMSFMDFTTRRRESTPPPRGRLFSLPAKNATYAFFVIANVTLERAFVKISAGAAYASQLLGHSLIRAVGTAVGWGYGLKRWASIVIAMILFAGFLSWSPQRVCMTDDHPSSKSLSTELGRGDCVSPGAGDLPKWRWWDAWSLSFNYSVPVVDLVSDRRWRLTDDPLASAMWPDSPTAWRWIPSAWGNLLRIFSWIAWPMLFLALTNHAKRD